MEAIATGSWSRYQAGLDAADERQKRVRECAVIIEADLTAGMPTYVSTHNGGVMRQDAGDLAYDLLCALTHEELVNVMRVVLNNNQAARKIVAERLRELIRVEAEGVEQ